MYQFPDVYLHRFGMETIGSKLIIKLRKRVKHIEIRKFWKEIFFFQFLADRVVGWIQSINSSNQFHSTLIDSIDSSSVAAAAVSAQPPV